MSSYFYLDLDTRPPANPVLLLNGGAAIAGRREVVVELATPDYGDGANDVAMMLLWGDVDPASDPLVQPTEVASTWQAYQPDYVLRLSDGSGRKTVNARLRDDVCNETPVFCDSIDLDFDSPAVTILTPADRTRISKVAPCDRAVFQWEANRPFTSYEVRAVPTIGAPHQAGARILTVNGSVNTQGVGAFDAETAITTTIHGADLEAASPGDALKLVKVFVRDATGVWSP